MKVEKRKIPKTRGGLAILIVAAVLLEAISCIMYFTSRSAIRHEAEQRAKTELRKAELEIEVHTVEMETAAKALALMVEKHPDEPDSVFSATRLAVSTLRSNTSMAVAFQLDHFPGHAYYEICSSRLSEDSIYTRQIGSTEHDYTQMEWYKNGLSHKGCQWSEPYMDDSGSKTMVVSCSYPVHDREGKVVGVVCVDMSLDALKNLSSYLQVYPNSYYSIRSGSGMNIVAAPDTVAGRKYNIFREEIEATGWRIEIIIPDEELFKDLNHIGRIIGLLMLFGLILLVFIVIRTGKNFINLVDLSNHQERIESELTIARNIQMAMLPTRFPPFEDYPNLYAHGIVIPAKEVGGDLFDFYIREGKLHFCIGDVSGKGVPASIVMAMTRSLFRSYTSYLDSPAQIVGQMNRSLAGEGNKQNMFVTLFLGILDLKTGELLYCNAGHNAPVRVLSTDRCADRAQMLPVVANLPLGIEGEFVYEEQRAQVENGDMLFLYTDGLTEAENSVHEQFGEARMMSELRGKSEEVRGKSEEVRGKSEEVRGKSEEVRGKSPREMVEAMQAAVAEFVGEAEQSDDLTMFAIQIEKEENHFSLVMRNDIEQIPTLAEWVETIGLPQELNMPINLALEEAVSNVMLYAYPGKSGQVLVECTKERCTMERCTMERCTMDEGCNKAVSHQPSAVRLIFTITDSGIPFDPTQQEDPDVTQNAEERPIGGLGIFLVKQIMDEVRYERKDGKNVLTLVKRMEN